jgi:hypothetical protein
MVGNVLRNRPILKVTEVVHNVLHTIEFGMTVTGPSRRSS